MSVATWEIACKLENSAKKAAALLTLLAQALEISAECYPSKDEAAGFYLLAHDMGEEIKRASATARQELYAERRPRPAKKGSAMAGSKGR